MTDETPTPKPRLKAEVATVLENSVHNRRTDPAPAKHETSEPVNVVDALAQMMIEHEKGEHAIAQELRAHVDEVETRAATERAGLSAKLDELTRTVNTAFDPDNGLPAMLKEVARTIANPFLARDDERRQQVEALQAEMNELKTEFTAVKFNYDRRLKEVEAQIRNLAGVGT